MNERVMQFRVGAMVVATVIITAILIVLFDGFPSLMERPYKVYIHFDSAPGVSVGTPVRESGILIGRVSKVQFARDIDPEHPEEHGVVITVEIEGKYRIGRDQVPRIDRSLLGDAVIEFVPPDRPVTIPASHAAGDHGNKFMLASQKPGAAALPPTVQPGEMLQGEVKSDALQTITNLEGDLGITMRSVAHTSDEIGLLARRVNDLLRNNEEQFTRVISKMEGAIDDLQATARSANELIGNPQMKENILKTADQLPKVLNQMNDAMASVQRTVDTADRNLRNFEGISKPLGDRGPALIANIERATGDLNTILRDVNLFTQALNSSEGTLGQLLNDKQLYSQVSQTIANVNRLTVELEPILRDARAFSDKIARHPEVLGVRGALSPSTGIK